MLDENGMQDLHYLYVVSCLKPDGRHTMLAAIRSICSSRTPRSSGMIQHRTLHDGCVLAFLLPLWLHLRLPLLLGAGIFLAGGLR